MTTLIEPTVAPHEHAVLQRRIAELEAQLAPLRASDMLVNAIGLSLPVVLYTIDRDGTFTRSEGLGLRTLGLEPGQGLGRSVFELYHEMPDIIFNIRRALAGESAHYTLEVQQAVFETWLAPIRDELGHVMGVLGLSLDITQRQRNELERARLQEQVIAVQQASLRELSTPLIPLAEGVVVMPLIGAIDSARAQQVLETLLAGVAEQHSAYAIVDITGVKVVDTQVAGALLRAAQAVRLLGAQIILTGISPEVAQTLVNLGADLAGIVTRSNLQSGIAYAWSHNRPI